LPQQRSDQAKKGEMQTVSVSSGNTEDEVARLEAVRNVAIFRQNRLDYSTQQFLAEVDTVARYLRRGHLPNGQRSTLGSGTK